MKKIIILIAFVISGCASKQPSVEYQSNAPMQTLIIDTSVQAMSRSEVIAANQECTGNDMRAVLVFGKRRIGPSNMSTDIIVDVACHPKPPNMFDLRNLR
jgi:hypothetical protein